MKGQIERHGAIHFYEEAPPMPDKMGKGKGTVSLASQSINTSMGDGGMMRYLEGNQRFNRDMQNLVKNSYENQEKLLKFQEAQAEVHQKITEGYIKETAQQAKTTTDQLAAMGEMVAKVVQPKARSNSYPGGHGILVRFADLPSFDGVDGMTFLEFQKEFERVHKLGRWTNEHALECLKASLKDGALELYTEEEIQLGGAFPDVDTAMHALRRNYLRRPNQYASLQKLNNIRQEPGEKVAQYYSRFLKLSEMAFDHLGPQSRETLGINYFTNGLRPTELRRVVERANFSRVSDAMQLASEEEGRNDRDARDTLPSSGDVTTPGICPKLSNVATLAQGKSQAPPRIDIQRPAAPGKMPATLDYLTEIAKGIAGNQCWKCKGWSHIGNECEAEANSGRYCFTCDGGGHTATTCILKQKDIRGCIKCLRVDHLWEQCPYYAPSQMSRDVANREITNTRFK
jgi:hypothetical protein